jgi:hypothetical protein
VVLGTMPATMSLAQSPIGSAAGVQNQVQGIVGGGAQTIAAGSSVFQNERVRTGEASQAKLVFLDQTNLDVGPKSEVTLNRFVYNPDRGTGNVDIEASRGVIRFVTGSQDPKNYAVKTPIATIEVRGTEFHLLVARSYIVVALVHGALRIVTLGGRVISLDQPFTAVTIFADGRVDGPTPWTGPFTRYAGDVPFPYFTSDIAASLPSQAPPQRGLMPVANHGMDGWFVQGNVGFGEATPSTPTATGNNTFGTTVSGAFGYRWSMGDTWAAGLIRAEGYSRKETFQPPIDDLSVRPVIGVSAIGEFGPNFSLADGRKLAPFVSVGYSTTLMKATDAAGSAQKWSTGPVVGFGTDIVLDRHWAIDFDLHFTLLNQQTFQTGPLSVQVRDQLFSASIGGIYRF